MYMLWEFVFEPRDLWVGLYWDYKAGVKRAFDLDLYICVVPTVPLHVKIWRNG
jgi:hypothetical protein